jgi:spore germination protein KA
MINKLLLIMKIFTYQRGKDDEGFILEENTTEKEAWQEQHGSRAGGERVNKSSVEGVKQGDGGEASSGEVSIGEVSIGREAVVRKRSDRRRIRKTSPNGEKKDTPPGKAARDDGLITNDLQANRKIIETLYGLPVNKDIVVREFELRTVPGIKAMLVFMDGLVDKAIINHLLQSLMLFSGVGRPGGRIADFVKENLLPGNQVQEVKYFKDVLKGVNFGDSAFFFEGSDRALVVETKGIEHRAVDRPNTEQTVRGPQEGFGEILRVNTALIRKHARSGELTTEMFTVGERLPNDVAIMYLRDLANAALVNEVKRRIKSIKIDYMMDSGMLEGLIEDSPYNLNPQTIATERPDRVVAFLAEGKVAILVNGSPQVLVVPCTMYAQLHTGEESYLRWQYGTFIRYVRLVAFYISFLLPGVYLSIVLFHQEMIPTELLLAIAGNRERVPFPSVVELLLLEFSFELVREAGVRIPGVIGTTIGIVGALILGQASVQANIASPILVVLVAVTGLSSFAVPNFALAFTLRIYRFFYIILGGLLGFFGITIGLFVQILLTTNLKSFGVPYLSPSGPRTGLGYDVVYRLPLFFHEKRPDYDNPQDVRRAPNISRGWVKRGGGKNGGSD